MFKKTKEELPQTKPDLWLMLLSMLPLLLPHPPATPPTTIINIYSDKKVEIKDVEQFFKDDESTNAK